MSEFVWLLKKWLLNANFKRCGVLQGSVLGRLLVLIYVNLLKDASESLDSIMLANNTNLFYSHKNIKDLFYAINLELEKISYWCKANKLSSNIKKTKFTSFLLNMKYH